jgi:NDP-hexose-3-ketoreductase
MGCASIARRRMLAAFLAVAETNLVAVASRDRGRAAETAAVYGCLGIHGYDDLLAMEEVEAVYLPLPVALHRPWAERLLQAGKHVLAEKPLACDPEQAAQLVRLAEAAGLTLAENVMFPHHSQHATVRQLLTGPPLGFSATFSIPARPPGDIRLSAELGGGALADAAVYPVRAAMYFLGDVELAGAVLRQPPGSEVETSGAILLRTPEGIGAQLSFGFGLPYRSDYEICDADGRYRVEQAFTPPADHRPVVLKDDAPMLTLAPDDQVANAVRAFARMVRGGAGNQESAVILRTAELLAEVRVAARRAPVKLHQSYRAVRPC